MKRSFFQAAVVSILLYGCTTWTLTKHMEKKLDWQQHKNAASNFEQVLEATNHQLYGHRHPITKTIQVRQTRHAGHCWRSRNELISDVLLWTPSYGRAKAGRPARTYIQQLCEDTRCSPDDLRGCPRDVMVNAMDCGIVVSEFVLQWHYYVYFLANTLGKGMNPLILPAMGK